MLNSVGAVVVSRKNRKYESAVASPVPSDGSATSTDSVVMTCRVALPGPVTPSVRRCRAPSMMSATPCRGAPGISQSASSVYRSAYSSRSPWSATWATRATRFRMSRAAATVATSTEPSATKPSATKPSATKPSATSPPSVCPITGPLARHPAGQKIQVAERPRLAKRRRSGRPDGASDTSGYHHGHGHPRDRQSRDRQRGRLRAPPPPPPGGGGRALRVGRRKGHPQRRRPRRGHHHHGGRGRPVGPAVPSGGGTGRAVVRHRHPGVPGQDERRHHPRRPPPPCRGTRLRLRRGPPVGHR